MIFRKEPRASNGWNNGDIDVAFQLFSCGMVWDGNVTSKSSRDHLVARGYAVRHEGMQSLTGKGIVAFLLHHRTWISAFNRWRHWRKNSFIASAEKIRDAMR